MTTDFIKTLKDDAGNTMAFTFFDDIISYSSKAERLNEHDLDIEGLYKKFVEDALNNKSAQRGGFSSPIKQ